MRRAYLPALLLFGATCGGPLEDRSGDDARFDGASTEANAARPAESNGEEPPPLVGFEEPFERDPFGPAEWRVDEVPDDGPFSDEGEFFTARGVTAPRAFRLTQSFGDEGWLTLESYTRRENAPLSDFAEVIDDPADPNNKVLRIASREHTDATVIRPTHPLPRSYRISLRVGFPRIGDGLPGLNGYDDEETAEPWWPEDDARRQNGFYWLAILDATPRPHNNTWIHHHRKVVIDSDNHFPPWMEIFDGEAFVPSGEHPVMMFAIDGRGEGDERAGKPFVSWADDRWQPSGSIRAVDAYLSDEWYEVSIERDGDVFTLEVSGRFAFGGQRTYRASIDARDRCVFHFNRPGEEAAHCVDEGRYASLGPDSGYAHWPAETGWPDFFMFGDPHSNYYEGEVLYDDVRLEIRER